MSTHLLFNHLEVPEPVDGFPDFGHLPLRHVHNTRDLGGMPTMSGKRIRSHRLIRSSKLHGLTKEGAQVLLRDEELHAVVDFRTELEAHQSPDPMELLPGVSHYLYPVFEESAVGITHEAGLHDDLEALKELGSHPLETVKKLYPLALLGSDGKEAYGKFFQLLLASKEGSVLWHCTEGKDRAGEASILVEASLGVSRENIYKDYLATNLFAQNPAERMLDGLARHHVAESLDNIVQSVFYAHRAYIDAAFDAVENSYGSMDAYLEKALGIGATEKEELARLYLA